MATDFIEDRPGGPALVGTRLFIDDMLTYLSDPKMTESTLASSLGLDPVQVAAARAYILENPGPVFARRMEFEQRPEPQNPPEVVERLRAAHENMMAYRAWRISEEDRYRREAEETGPPRTFSQWVADRRSREAMFREWLAASESRSAVFREWLAASGSDAAMPHEWPAASGS